MTKLRLQNSLALQSEGGTYVVTIEKITDGGHPLKKMDQ
jgi:hypothetical protein